MALNGMDSRRDCSSHCFSFEQDFIGNWRCIPLCVRRKLDLVGIKLKLNHWLALEQQQRQQLVDWSDAPAEWAGFRQHLRDLTVGMADGMVKDLPPAVDAPWQCMDQVPLAIAEAADQRIAPGSAIAAVEALAPRAVIAVVEAGRLASGGTALGRRGKRAAVTVAVAVSERAERVAQIGRAHV